VAKLASEQYGIASRTLKTLSLIVAKAVVEELVATVKAHHDKCADFECLECEQMIEELRALAAPVAAKEKP
jgi:hypothetical protein